MLNSLKSIKKRVKITLNTKYSLKVRAIGPLHTLKWKPLASRGDNGAGGGGGGEKF